MEDILLAAQRQGTALIMDTTSGADFAALAATHHPEIAALCIAYGMATGTVLDSATRVMLRAMVETAFVLGYQAGQVASPPADDGVDWGA